MKKDKFKQIDFKESGKFTTKVRKLLSFILFFIILCGYIGLAGYQYYVSNATGKIGFEAEEFESSNNFNNLTIFNTTEEFESAKFEVKGGFTIDNSHDYAISIRNLVLEIKIFSDDDTDNLLLASDKVEKDILAGEITEVKLSLGVDYDDIADGLSLPGDALEIWDNFQDFNDTLKETEYVRVEIDFSFEYALNAVEAEIILKTDFGGMDYDTSI